MGRREQTVYTLEQVAEHNHKDDCWIVVDNKVGIKLQHRSGHIMEVVIVAG